MTDCVADVHQISVESLIQELREILDRYLGEDIDQNELTLELSAHVLKRSEEEVRELYYSIVRNENLDIVIRFSAYYSVFCYYIHIKCFNKMDDLFGFFCDNISLPKKCPNNLNYSQNNYSRFIAFNNAILSQHYLDVFDKLEDGGSITNALRYAEEAVNTLKDNAGALQNYADIVATGAEKDIPGFKDLVDKATERITEAIEKRGKFGLYYCTLGRLLSLKGDYLEAKINIRKAIGLEPRNELDSYRRVLLYQYYFDCVNLNEEKLGIQVSFSKINDALEEHQTKLNDIQIRNIELVSLFSGIVALVLTIPGVVSKTNDFREAIGLILSMGGVISLSFLLLPTIINSKKAMKLSFIGFVPFIIGILLIVLGTLIGSSSLLSVFSAWLGI